MTKIVLYGWSEAFRDGVAEAYAENSLLDLRALTGHTFDPDSVTEIIALAPDLVVVGPSIEDGDALKMVEELDRAAPHISVVMIAYSSGELWPQALRAGVRDIISPLTGSTPLRESLDRAIEAGRRLIDSVSDPEEQAASGRVLTVISPKGGSGKTMVATNLAVTLARTYPDETVLADLDVQFGDLAYALRLDSEYSFLHAVGDGVTPTMLKGFLTPHPSKVLTLTAPEHPEDADDIPPDRASETIRQLAAVFPFVIVDTAGGIGEHTLAALEVATDLIFVSATDVPSVRGIVKELDILERLGLLGGRRHHLVLNRADARVGLSPGDISETIGMEVSLLIPSERGIPAALNLGEAYVSTDERSPVAKRFRSFADGLSGGEPTRPSAKWSWRAK